MPPPHFDHIGFAERARVESASRCGVHENDVPLTRGRGVHERTQPALVSRPQDAADRVLSSGPGRRACTPSARCAGSETEGPSTCPAPPCPVHAGPHLGHVALSPARARRGHHGDALVTHTPTPTPGAPDRCAGGNGRQWASACLAQTPSGHGRRDAPAGHGALEGGAERAVQEAGVWAPFSLGCANPIHEMPNRISE